MIKSITANMMVTNVKESVSFYCDTLGFSLINSVASHEGYLNFAILSKDEQLIMLQQKDNFIAEYPILNTEKVSPSISLYIVVDNFDDMYNLVKDKALVLIDIHTTFYGSKEFAIADNNGYVITIVEEKI